MDKKFNKNYNCLNQNQPEGISMAVPMKNGGMTAIGNIVGFLLG